MCHFWKNKTLTVVHCYTTYATWRSKNKPKTTGLLSTTIKNLLCHSYIFSTPLTWKNLNTYWNLQTAVTKSWDYCLICPWRLFCQVDFWCRYLAIRPHTGRIICRASLRQSMRVQVLRHLLRTFFFATNTNCSTFVTYSLFNITHTLSE